MFDIFSDLKQELEMPIMTAMSGVINACSTQSTLDYLMELEIIPKDYHKRYSEILRDNLESVSKDTYEKLIHGLYDSEEYNEIKEFIKNKVEQIKNDAINAINIID